MKIYRAVPPNFGFYFLARNKWWWVGKSREIIEVTTNLAYGGLDYGIDKIMQPSNPLEFLVLMGGTVEQAVGTVNNLHASV